MQPLTDNTYSTATLPPQMLSMAMTSRCNLRCVMCDHGIRNVKKEDFKADLVDMAGDFIGSAALVDLTGLGEPMLSDLFWKILQKFPVSEAPQDGEFFLTFNTNGTLLNERNIARVMNSRMRKIRVSLDAADPDLFQKIRGTDLGPIVAGLRALVKARNESGHRFPKIGVEMTLMRDNLADVVNMIDLCTDIGVDFLEVWSLNQVAKSSRTNWQVKKGNWVFDYGEQMVGGLPPEVLKAAVDQFYAHAELRGLTMASLIAEESRSTRNFRDPLGFSDHGLSVPWTPDSIRCDLPWRELRVTYDGDVFACCWGVRPIGNLRDQTLESIWNSVAIKRMRTDLVDGGIPDLCVGASCRFVGSASPLQEAEWVNLPDIGKVMELSAKPINYEPEAGLHDLETYMGRMLRWTDGAATLHVVALEDCSSMGLEVRLWPLGDGIVQISVNDQQALLSFVAPDAVDAVIELGAVSAGQDLIIRVDSTLFEPESDSRQLGVAIESLRLIARSESHERLHNAKSHSLAS